MSQNQSKLLCHLDYLIHKQNPEHVFFFYIKGLEKKERLQKTICYFLDDFFFELTTTSGLGCFSASLGSNHLSG